MFGAFILGGRSIMLGWLRRRRHQEFAKLLCQNELALSYLNGYFQNDQNALAWVNDASRRLHTQRPRLIGNQSGGRVFLFLQTDNFWRDYKRFVAAGVEFIRAPSKESYGMVAVFQDLYGNRWDLLQYNRSTPYALGAA